MLTCIQNNQAARKNSIQNAALKITQVGEVVQFLEAGDAAWEGVVVLLRPLRPEAFGKSLHPVVTRLGQLGGRSRDKRQRLSHCSAQI